jgi:hypothetical protein
MSEDRTEPPEKFKHLRFHWLHAERASAPSIAEWWGEDWRTNPYWRTIGETDRIPPSEMRHRGWEYLGPVTHQPPSKYLDGEECETELLQMTEEELQLRLNLSNAGGAHAKIDEIIGFVLESAGQLFAACSDEAATRLRDLANQLRLRKVVDTKNLDAARAALSVYISSTGNYRRL